MRFFFELKKKHFSLENPILKYNSVNSLKDVSKRRQRFIDDEYEFFHIIYENYKTLSVYNLEYNPETYQQKLK